MQEKQMPDSPSTTDTVSPETRTTAATSAKSVDEIVKVDPVLRTTPDQVIGQAPQTEAEKRSESAITTSSGNSAAKAGESLYKKVVKDEDTAIGSSAAEGLKTMGDGTPKSMTETPKAAVAVSGPETSAPKTNPQALKTGVDVKSATTDRPTASTDALKTSTEAPKAITEVPKVEAAVIRGARAEAKPDAAEPKPNNKQNPPEDPARNVRRAPNDPRLARRQAEAQRMAAGVNTDGIRTDGKKADDIRSGETDRNVNKEEVTARPVEQILPQTTAREKPVEQKQTAPKVVNEPTTAVNTPVVPQVAIPAKVPTARTETITTPTEKITAPAESPAVPVDKIAAPVEKLVAESPKVQL
jgi:hypothetical protein